MPGRRGIATTQQPQLFLLTDVREIPHQRAHQRVVLAPQFGVIEVDQPQRALSAFVSSRANVSRAVTFPLVPVG